MADHSSATLSTLCIPYYNLFKYKVFTQTLIQCQRQLICDCGRAHMQNKINMVGMAVHAAGEVNIDAPDRQ